MSTIAYTFTPDVVSKPLTLAASAEGLTVTGGAAPQKITWSDVMGVELWFDPTRFNRERYRCRISTRSGRVVEIESTTCRGVGDFVPQSAEYANLLGAIHVNLLAHGKNVAYRGGVGGSRYVLNLLALAIGVAAFSWALSVAGVSYLGPSVIAHLLVILFGASLAVKWVKKNRPTTYDPRTIPAELYPKLAAAKVLPAPNSESISAPILAPISAPMSAPVAPSTLPPRRKKPTLEDYGPIAEPGDSSWSSAGSNKTHWADAQKYLEEDLKKWEAEEQAAIEAEKRRDASK